MNAEKTHVDLSISHVRTLEVEALDLAGVQQQGQQLATRLRAGGWLGLMGPLGAGKTTLTQALVAALGYPGAVKSPSFVLQHLYKTEHVTIEHWDFYRLSDAPQESVQTFAREIGAHGSIVLIEWPEALLTAGLGRHLDVCLLQILDDTHRTISLWEPRA